MKPAVRTVDGASDVDAALRALRAAPTRGNYEILRNLPHVVQSTASGLPDHEIEHSLRMALVVLGNATDSDWLSLRQTFQDKED